MANNGSSLAKVDPQQALKGELEKIRGALVAVLPKHVTAERMLKVVLSATARQPALLECTKASIVRSVMQAGELGLEIGGLLGEAYLVPFKNKVKGADGIERWEKQAMCIPGYKGLIRLARNSGQIHTLSARVVHAHDRFHVNLAEEEIQHEPHLDAERDDDKIIAFYAIARFKDGAKQIEVMTRREVEAVRSRSKSADSGPWVTDFAEMGRKTVVRRLCKYLPLSPELARALEADAEADERDRAMTDALDVTLVSEEQPKTQAQHIAERVRARGAAKAPEAKEEPEPQGEPAAREEPEPEGRQPGED